MMKKFFEILAFSFISVLFFACSDSSSGFSAGDVCPESGRGTFIDDRDGQVYKNTTIGDQIWMAENLKYNAEYSVCYDSLNGFCDTYGRFYSLQKNGDGLAELDENLVASVCPAGWHVPSLAEWETMINEVGGMNNKESAKVIKKENSWEWGKTPNNQCGFSAIPAGAYFDDSFQVYLDFDAFFWTTTPRYEYYYSIHVENEISLSVNFARMSLRCVKD